MLQCKKDDALQCSSYVDGIPVKISEQYKPPRRVILPVSCQNCIYNESAVNEYDFTLENSVINKLAEWKKSRQEEVERRKERLKTARKVREEIEHFNKLAIEQTQAKEVEQATQILNPVLTDSVLTPVCATQHSPLPKPVSSHFNLSDFESDNSSPFDNMELKTINDMEVLASILTTDNTKRTLNNNNIIGKELGKNGFVSHNKNEWSDSPLNSYNNYDYSSPESRDFDQYGLYSVSENYHIYNYALNDFSNQFGAAVSSDHAMSSTSKQGTFVGAKLDTRPHTNLVQVRAPILQGVPDVAQDHENDVPEKILNDEKIKIEAIPSKPSTFLSTGLENWSPWPDLESPQRQGGNTLGNSPGSAGS